MQLSVVKQTYNGRDAAELAYAKRKYFMGYIRNQLKLKHINEAYVREYAEDVFHSGIVALMSSQYSCANADEAIVEAMSRAVQDAVRDLINRSKETSDTVTYSDSKDGDREVSRLDLQGGSASAEQVLLEQEEECSLEEAIERVEAVRYRYGFDIVLCSLLRAGTSKGLWSAAAVNGLLMAFESVNPSRKYHGDACIARVVSAAEAVDPEELIQVMRRNLSRCEEMLAVLGYSSYAH